MDSPCSELIAFGRFTLDAQSGELYDGTDRVAVQEQSVRLLLILLEAEGQVVRREALRAALWPADTFVDFEHGLNAAVRRLRVALGDSAEKPHFIETIPRRGYRFLVPTTRIRREKPRQAGPGPEGVDGRRAARRYRPSARVVTIMGAGVVAAAWLASRSSPIQTGTASDPSGELTSRLTRLTVDTGLNEAPSMATDTGLVIYAAERNGNVDVWAQHPSSGGEIRLTHDAAADWQPSVSPDGGQFVFRSERDGGGLFVAPVGGGPARRIAAQGYDPVWAPDGSGVLFSMRPVRTIETAPPLGVVRLGGQAPQALPAIAGPEFCCYRGAAWHPDGRRISMLWTDSGRSWTLATHSLGDKGWTLTSLTPSKGFERVETDTTLASDRMGSSLAWAPDGRALYFLAFVDGLRAIFRAEVDPGTLAWRGPPRRLTTGPVSIRDFSLSYDGRRIAFSTYEDLLRLWLFPLDPGTGHMLGTGAPVGEGGLWSMAPEIAPDQKHLAYSQVRGDRQVIAVRRLPDGEETILSPRDEFSRSHPRWTADGQFLTYSRRLTRPASSSVGTVLVQLDLRTRIEQPLVGADAPVGVGQRWSPDGRLLLVGWEGPAPWRATVALLTPRSDTRGAARVETLLRDASEDLFPQDRSPDGQWVGFNAITPKDQHRSRLFVANPDREQRQPVGSPGLWEDKLRWHPDGRLIYFVSDAGGFFNVWARRFDSDTGLLAALPFQVSHFDGPARGMPTSATASSMNIDLGRNLMVVPVLERRGSIWLLRVGAP